MRLQNLCIQIQVGKIDMLHFLTAVSYNTYNIKGTVIKYYFVNFIIIIILYVFMYY